MFNPVYKVRSEIHKSLAKLQSAQLNANPIGDNVSQRPKVVIMNAECKKSMGLGLVLMFFFGPLGMLYAAVPGALIMFLFAE